MNITLLNISEWTDILKIAVIRLKDKKYMTHS